MPISADRLAQFRRAAAVEVVWLVELTLGSTVQRWASRAITLGGQAYEPFVDRSGLRFGRNSLRDRGGLSAVGSTALTVKGVDLVALAGDNVLINAPVGIFQLFVDGTETADEKISLSEGAVETVRPLADGRWEITVKDDSLRVLVAFPNANAQIGPDRYPFAQNFGHVLPAVFGELTDQAAQSGPWQAPDQVAPCEVIDLFAGPRLHVGIDTASVAALWQWHPSGSVMSQVVDWTRATDGTVTIDTPTRRIVTRAIRDTPTNEVTDWNILQTYDPDAFLDIANGDTVAVYMAGLPALGPLASIAVQVDARGSYDYRIVDNQDELSTGTQSGNGDFSLDRDRFENWGINLLQVELTGDAGFELLDLRLQIEFDVIAGSAQGQQESYWFSGVGKTGQNPVDQLEDMFTDTDLLDRPAGVIVGGGWDEARGLRSTWPFDLALAGPSPGNQAFLSKLAFDMGCVLHPGEGGFTLAPLDERRDPSLFISSSWHSPRTANGTLDFERNLNEANSQLINEVSLRFGLHAPSGQHRKAATASGQYRFTSTCQLHDDGRLVDAAGDFEDRQVLVGERVFVEGEIDYVVTEVTSATELRVRPARSIYSTIVAKAAGTTYYLGPNIDGAMLESQEQYRVRQPLGEAQVAFTDEGGYRSDTIQADETAQAFLRYITRWFSQVRDQVRFTVGHVAAGVRPGDVLLLDHELTADEQQPTEATQLASAVDAADSSISIDALGPIRRRYWLILYDAAGEPEVMRVNRVTFGAAPGYAVSTLGVDRAQLGTRALSFAVDTPVLLTRWKWLVLSVGPMTPDTPTVGLTLASFPKPVEDVRMVVPNGFPDYVDATNAQREYGLFTANPNAQIGSDFSRFGF